MTTDDIEKALAGDRAALRALYHELGRVIQFEIGRVLHRATAAENRDPREETRDMVTEVLVKLLADDTALLRAWDPSRGTAFIRTIARRHAISVLRSNRRSPFFARPVPEDTLDRHRAAAPELARAVEERELMDWLLQRLEEELGEEGFALFRMLYVEELGIEEVCERTGKSRDALYAWRLRLKRRVERLLAEFGER